MPDGKRIVILNKESAAEDNVMDTAGHEIGHVLVYETVKNKPEAAIALGTSLLEELKNSKDITFTNSITETYRNSLEIKAEKYRLAAIKHSLGEAYSSKDWNSSYTANLNSSNKQSDFEGSYVNDDVITSTLSLSKNLFDGGKKYEKTLIAKDNVKMHIQKLKVVEQNVILKGVKAYLDVYSSQSVVKLRSISLERFKGHVKACLLYTSDAADE